MSASTTGFLPHVFHGHTRPINYLCFNEDCDLLCAASSDNTCSLWWTHNAEPARVLSGHEGAISSVALTSLLHFYHFPPLHTSIYIIFHFTITTLAIIRTSICPYLIR